MSSVFEWYARQLLARPKAFLALAFFLTLLFAWFGKDVRLNNHFAVLFAIDNEANAYRNFYREAFGADDAVLVAAIRLQQAPDQALFDRIDSVTRELESNPHFIRVYSPANTAVVWSEGDEVYIDPLFGDYDDGSLTLQRKLELLRESPVTAGRLVSTVADTVAIMAQMPDNYDRYNRIREPAEQFRQLIDQRFADQPAEIHYAGIAFTRIGILTLMMQDLLMLVPLTGIAIAIFSLWLFRRWLVVWATLLTTLFGLACTIGVMGLNDDDINQLTLTFPVLLMVIIVANSIHFFHRYFREIGNGQSVATAVRVTAVQVGQSAFLSCFTTMIGFYALMTADMAILRSFGFYLGSGVLMSYIGMLLVIPACLLLAAPAPVPQRHDDNDWLQHMVGFCITPRGRRQVTLAGVVVLLAGSWLASHADYDYFLSDMLDDDHPQVLAGTVLDTELAGALPVEISLLGEAGDFRTAQGLFILHQLGEWLQREAGSNSVLSLASVIGSLNQAMGSDKALPDDANAIAQLLLLAEGSSDGIVQQLVSEDFSHARIKSNLPDLGAERIMQLQTRLHDYAAELTKDSNIRVRMTGEIPVAYEGMNKLTHELIKSVLTAMVFVVLTIFVVFRDIRLALGSIFPNLLPIVFGLGIYALSGQALNPLPGIAFCIAIGIAVDDTVHLFARFNEELAKGSERNQAILDAVREVKGALISSSVMLTAGFAVFLLSAFTWNRELGMLGVVLILSALAADLVFTPAILSFQRATPAVDKP